MQERSRTRVNGFGADTCERAAALRYHLDRVDEWSCDAYATTDTPVIPDGTPVEVKACRPWIANGDDYGTTGRWHINRPTHRDLVDADGWYVFCVYDVVHDEHVVLYRSVPIVASVVGRALPATAGDAVKLPWTAVFRDLPDSATASRGDGR